MSWSVTQIRAGIKGGDFFDWEQQGRDVERRLSF